MEAEFEEEQVRPCKKGIQTDADGKFLQIASGCITEESFLFAGQTKDFVKAGKFFNNKLGRKLWRKEYF